MDDFGAAMRELRERAEPGVPETGRRVRGLRREELAERAGVSADYVRRLEQGRSHPSAGVVNAIARALRAGRADYERLCALAGYAPSDGQVPHEPGPAAMRLLERFGDTPAFLCDAAWNAVAVNGAWLALAPGAPTGDARDWNVAWRTFTSPLGGISRSPEHVAGFRALLASRLRSASLRYRADASLAALVDDLRTTSRTFDTLWRTPGAPVTPENRAVFGGDLALDGNLLAVPGDDLMAVVLTAAPGSPDAARLAERVAHGSRTAVRVGQPGPG
ncbi:helix-turn-helix domain-containing protein [Cryptosporangium sp. NPDC051539]|uniref:helix-turn-helix domain-containing protein n=1 Tax=Cryptosporangium sp. NPDC051539 TaxID=3363962 RepID=UPI0037A348EB